MAWSADCTAVAAGACVVVAFGAAFFTGAAVVGAAVGAGVTTAASVGGGVRGTVVMARVVGGLRVGSEVVGAGAGSWPTNTVSIPWTSAARARVSSVRRLSAIGTSSTLTPAITQMRVSNGFRGRCRATIGRLRSLRTTGTIRVAGRLRCRCATSFRHACVSTAAWVRRSRTRKDRQSCRVAFGRITWPGCRHGP